jgi:hypothetical protein
VSNPNYAEFVQDWCRNCRYRETMGASLSGAPMPTTCAVKAALEYEAEGSLSSQHHRALEFYGDMWVCKNWRPEIEDRFVLRIQFTDDAMLEHTTQVDKAAVEQLELQPHHIALMERRILRQAQKGRNDRQRLLFSGN